MKEIVADESLVAYCGLYCGACKIYLWGKCPGCSKNEKAAWCKVRTCCIEKKLRTCADCDMGESISNCAKLVNPISKIIGFFLRSNRLACLAKIKEKGCSEYAKDMAEKKRASIK